MRNHIVDAHHFDAYPGSTYHPDADPDSVQEFYYYLMRNRIQLFTRIRIQIQASK